MNIAICCDHGGLNLKNAVKTHLEQAGHTVTDFGTSSEIVDTFLNTPFSAEEKHQRRIDKITAIEKKYSK